MTTEEPTSGEEPSSGERLYARRRRLVEVARNEQPEGILTNPQPTERLQRCKAETPLIEVSYLIQSQPKPNRSVNTRGLPLAWNATVSGYFVTPERLDGFVTVNNIPYRGRLWVKPAPNNSFVIINILNLEDYLLSVLPSEMPSNWPREALKAQAIAARSYA
ncbi:MAG: SpoIID/LytB domain-containing protein, partial [Candidatus Melainabacteria bacterium]|nr:SpoIID/LytB domain-containing protein [Candidatus Melainabacteria bacterium]